MTVTEGRPSAFATVVVLVGAAAVLMGTAGNSWFERVFLVREEYAGAGRASLMACGATFAAFLAATHNFVRVAAGRPPVLYHVPERATTWLRTGAAFSVGVLIGTTIFR